MRKLFFLRCLPVALLLVIGVFTFLNTGTREHRRLTDPFKRILQQNASKKQHCQAYFGNLEKSLDRDALLKESTPKKAWIRTFIGHLRAYGACYVENGVGGLENVGAIEEKLFPLFSGKAPVVTKWDGSKVSGENQMDKTIPSFWGKFKKSFSGKGIVLSISDAGVEEGTRLLRVLRFLENDLPIQMVHKGDLSVNSLNKLVRVAREDMVFEHAQSSLNPAQDVYFVDASGCLKESAHGYFRRFANKWVASLFSTWDEMVLMDTDVVPFIKPRELFKYQEYKENGAFFFRDRLTKERTWTTPMGFFRSLHPTLDEQVAFGIKNYTDFSEKTGFFQSKSKHVMESGMVVMKRSTHLTGLLISTAMQFWHETSGPFYGDKELFWLGQIYAGQAPFAFNSRAAAGIGELQEKKNSWEVCSTQPAHFDLENRLLWLNGGLQKCKKGYFQKDFDNLRLLRDIYKTPEKLHDHYRSPTIITGAIIPQSKLDFVQDESKGCIGYVWCASVPKSQEHNSVVEFSQKQLVLILEIERLWYGEEFKKYT